MRIAEVSGGAVVAIHSSPSVANLQEFLTLRGVVAQAVEAPAWVQIGTAYDGTDFVEPEPAHAPEPLPLPAPRTVHQIANELDIIREQKISDYISQWGNISKIELWPMLSEEIARAATVTAETLLIDEFPSITGFLIASGVEVPTAAQIYGTAASLRLNKIAHVSLLRKTELIRQQLILQYQELSHEAKLTWVAAMAWAEVVS